MNTANLQLQGVLTVVASLLKALEEKGALSRAEIEKALDRAESEAAAGAQHERLSDANIEAVRFPARFLRASLAAKTGNRSFAAVAMDVGQRKDDVAASASLA